jgi:hypothetical protein
VPDEIELLMLEDPPARPSEPTDAPLAEVPAGEGADAGPRPLNGIADMSQAAADNFARWWAYEVQTMQDWQRGAGDVYADGVVVCSELALDKQYDAVTDHLVRDKGYTGSGASAVYAAALRSLCPHRNQGLSYTDRIEGYLTYFDRQVALAYAGFMGQVRFTSGSPPTVYDIGWVTKATCTHLTQHGSADGLLEVVTEAAPYFANTTPYPRLTEVAVTEAAGYYCLILADRLGAAWYSDP